VADEEGRALLGEADRRNLATTFAAMLESYGDVRSGVDD
jgi:hypothetical protein